MGQVADMTSSEPLTEVLTSDCIKIPITLVEYQSNCLRIMAVKYFHKFCVNFTQVDLLTIELLCHGFVKNFSNIIPYYLQHQGYITKYLEVFDRHKPIILRYVELSDQIFSRLDEDR
jgi:hypothetical protein